MALPRSGRAAELLGARERVAGLYGDALGGIGGARRRGDGDPDGLVLPCADAGECRRSWFVYMVRLPSGADRDAVMAALDRGGIESKAYLPCIHLMPHYRERFGFEGGEFPVAEEVAERSLALPFPALLKRARSRASPRRWAQRSAPPPADIDSHSL